MPRVRILLDQNAPLGLRRLLTGHDVVTAARLDGPPSKTATSSGPPKTPGSPF
jgi:hypothetical protein